jgi:hypothetical protein
MGKDFSQLLLGGVGVDKGKCAACMMSAFGVGILVLFERRYAWCIFVDMGQLNLCHIQDKTIYVGVFLYTFS